MVRRRVLIIDDYRDALDALRVLLETSGYEVEAVANGTNGLAAFFACPPDIVPVDLHMPDIDGCDALCRAFVPAEPP